MLTSSFVVLLVSRLRPDFVVPLTKNSPKKRVMVLYNMRLLRKPGLTFCICHGSSFLVVVGVVVVVCRVQCGLFSPVHSLLV